MGTYRKQLQGLRGQKEEGIPEPREGREGEVVLGNKKIHIAFTKAAANGSRVLVAR